MILEDLEEKYGHLSSNELNFQPSDIFEWNCDDVCRYLASLGLKDYDHELIANRVDGRKFLQLDGSKLKTIGISNQAHRNLIKKRIKDLKVAIERERRTVEKENKQKKRSSSLTSSTRKKLGM